MSVHKVRTAHDLMFSPSPADAGGLAALMRAPRTEQIEVRRNLLHRLVQKFHRPRMHFGMRFFGWIEMRRHQLASEDHRRVAIDGRGEQQREDGHDGSPVEKQARVEFGLGIDLGRHSGLLAGQTSFQAQRELRRKLSSHRLAAGVLVICGAPMLALLIVQMVAVIFGGGR